MNVIEKKVIVTAFLLVAMITVIATVSAGVLNAPQVSVTPFETTPSVPTPDGI